MGTPTDVIAAELAALPEANPDGSPPTPEASGEFETPQDAFNSDLTSDFANMDESYVEDTGVDIASISTPAPPAEDKTPPVTEEPAPKTEEFSVADILTPPPVEEVEEVTDPAATSTDEPSEPVLQLTRSELMELLQNRGTPPGEEEAPASSESETVDSDAARQQAWDNSYNRYVEMYAINDEDAARLITEPEAVLPRMAAQITMRTVEAVMSLLPQAVPSLVQAHTQQAEVEAVKQTAMSRALGGVDVRPEYLEAAEGMIRKLSPDLERTKPEDFALATVGILRNVLSVPATPAQTESTPAPAAPARRTGRVPAAARTVSQTPPGSSNNEENVFSSMAEEDIKSGM